MHEAGYKDYPKVVVLRNDLNAIFKILLQKGYETIGPTVSDNVIIYDKISSIEELPVGLTDRQDSGAYQLIKGNGRSLFDYVVEALVREIKST